MRTLSFLVVCVLAMAVTAGEASAAPIYSDSGVTIDAFDPVVGDSFQTGFSFGGFATFASMDAFIVSESGQGPFQAPGIRIDTTDGSVINPSYASVAGSFGPNGSVALFLAGSPAGTLVIDLLSYDSGGNLINFSGGGAGLTGRFTFTNGFLTRFQPDVLEDSYNITPIPEPATLSLFALGLLGAAAAGWRRRRGR